MNIFKPGSFVTCDHPKGSVLVLVCDGQTASKEYFCGVVVNSSMEEFKPGDYDHTWGKGMFRPFEGIISCASHNASL